MRQLIVCCDGTWNTPEDSSVTNVRRLYNALADTDDDGNEQVRFYQPGVGTAGPLWDRLVAGATGAGLTRNILDAYHWLTTRYEHGDRIALFGFSRGAYTARSLAGMIGACGLIDTTALDDAAAWDRIRYVYRRYRHGRDGDRRWRNALAFRYDPDNRDQIPVHLVGVFDTVGALGIPGYLGWLKLLEPRGGHDFHDLTLHPHIAHARHAVAMDERRSPFAPALWTGPFATGQDVRQVWFPGSHQDVGGGHRETGLSDGALQWMIDEARAAAGIGFEKVAIDQVRPDALDRAHDDDRGVVGLLEPVVDPVLSPWLDAFLEPRPRAVPLLDPNAPSQTILRSAYERQQDPSITGGRYRATRTLDPGESMTVDVLAYEPWNETGLYLHPGDYFFTADGQWRDGPIAAGPAGNGGLRLANPVTERLRVLGNLAGRAQRVARLASRNRAVTVLGARREADLPWMSLVGYVANDAVPVRDAVKDHERIAIGDRTRHRVSRGGYLYTFANDSWPFYGNNQGSVRLTIRRDA
jgi:uncharacterized protein (DUF2235 family)